MSHDTLAPVLPSFSALTATDGLAAIPGAPGLPLGNVELPPKSSAVHSIRPVDTNGRVIDKAVLTALDWRPGDLLSWRINGGLIVITRPGYGRRGVTKHGHLSLPAAVRRGAYIGIHDRVLLAADPEQSLLVVYPAHVLDEILARRFAEGAEA
ncbi:AbrB/MazE/SpoVT family DNA-binding domain-containing protein [Nocardia sp. NBC_00403]|uniref:AbrB/MazE/SpoVT family DNA-binding domain-containing protein n=1 Tax=Nocardia sp. NBC_00403 TaxID=2975990 RepID=UPI002E1FFED4